MGKIVILCCNTSECKPLDLPKRVIKSFIDSRSDKLFQNILSDIDDAETRDLSLQDTIEYALEKHRKSIIATVDRFEACGKDDSIWKPCHCDNCNGLNTHVEILIKVFAAMEEDDLIQRIVVDIEEMRDNMELDDAIDQTVDRYRKDIFAEFRNARKVVEASGWDIALFF